MDFASITEPDVLQNFDFDSFLNNDPDDYATEANAMEAMNFVSAMPGDTVEAGGVDNP